MQDTIISISGKLVKEINAVIKTALEVNYMKKPEVVIDYAFDKVGSFYFVTQKAFELYWKDYIQKYLNKLKQREKKDENKVARTNKVKSNLEGE